MAVTQIGHVDVEFTTGVFDYTVTPDSSIAVDDWMIAVVVSGQGQVLTTPTGWSALFPSARITGTLSTNILYKKRLAGETSYPLHFSDTTSSAKVSLMWFRGVADIGWILPSEGRSRSTTGSTFNNIADPITTTMADTFVLTVSTERTTATEVSYTSMTGSAPWFYVPQTGTQIETIATGTRAYPSPGTTDPVTIVYPNTQANNGWAIQLGLPPKMEAVSGPLRLWTGSAETALSASIWDGTSEVSVGEITPYTGDYTISDLLSTDPFYIAHRGSGDNWPEHTMRAYTGAVNWGMKAIEISVNVTSDGVMFCHHDRDTNHMTGTNLVFTSSTADQISALTNTAAYTVNPTQDRQPIPRLVPVLDKFATNHVCFVEAKSGGAWQTDLLNLLASYPDYTNRIVWKAPIWASFTAAKARGLITWGYLFQTDPLNADWQTMVSKPDVDIIGVNHTATDQYISDVVALATSLGKKVIMWEIHTPADRDRAVSLGVVGMMTSNIWEVLPKFAP